MKNYRQYLFDIQGFKDVAETVKTVEKIAAAEIHGMKNTVDNLRLYTGYLNKILLRLGQFHELKSNRYLNVRKRGKKVLLIISSDKGLAGGLWHQLVNKYLDSKLAYDEVLVSGEKAARYLEEEKITYTSIEKVESMVPTRDETQALYRYLIENFNSKRWKSLDILYLEFVTIAEHTPKIFSWLPFNLEDDSFNKNMFLDGKHEGFTSKKSVTVDGWPIFEGSKVAFFENLLHQYMEVIWYRLILESRLCELSARTVAMEHAEVMSKKLIKQIGHEFVKSRRDRITRMQLASFVVHNL